MMVDQNNPVTRRAILRKVLAVGGLTVMLGVPLAGPAQSQNTGGAIIGTLGDERVAWGTNGTNSSFWFLGEGEAIPSLGGTVYRVPEGVGPISFTMDLSDGREDFLMLEIRSADGEKVLWRADAHSDVTLRASYRQLPESMASIMGDLRVVLDTVDEAGETAARGAGPELLISFSTQLAQEGH